MGSSIVSLVSTNDWNKSNRMQKPLKIIKHKFRKLKISNLYSCQVYCSVCKWGKISYFARNPYFASSVYTRARISHGAGRPLSWIYAMEYGTLRQAG